MARLNVNIGALKLKNPVLTASGTFGYGEEFADFIDLSRLGGFIIKGTTLNHREGNPYPRMVETPSGMLNAVGLQNKGVDYMIEHIYPRIKDAGSEVIVNVSGATVDAYVPQQRHRGKHIMPQCKARRHGIRHQLLGSRRGDACRKTRLSKERNSKIVAQRDIHRRHCKSR